MKSGPSKRWLENEELLVNIKKVFEASSGSYGSPRIATELYRLAFQVSRQRTARIMKAAGIRAKRKRKFVATTDSRHGYPVAPNVLNREFTVARPAQLWDIKQWKNLN